MRKNFFSISKELYLKFKTRKCKIVTGLISVAIIAVILIVTVTFFLLQKEKPIKKSETSTKPTPSASISIQNDQRRAESGKYF